MNAEDIFQQAIDGKTPAEREAFVASACGTDGALFAKVQGLLKAHDDASQFLEKPLFVSTPTVEQPLYERPSTQIGPYKLLQQIGEGGMGIVFMAEQTQPVQRKVALKIIRPGMDSRQVIARFEAERQALAMMDHVNIARVFDGGTTESGRPYFVMELINGVPITKYCDDNHLTPRERLELFVPVCQAIQHAHQKGIIHRDIKPSNVLVTLYDGKPVPKVIDFGVAKATEQKLTERTLFTNSGTMVGTLEYMSPEQAEMSNLGIDTRSDIYSLGVLLYELLTGSTPLTRQQLKQAANLEILRLIKEEEPQKPSTRLSESGDALASISAHRKTEPAKLSKLVRGELDWIVMKTLEKDRNRRYETANGLGRDIQRYLADESVEACPPSVGYRMGKFVRRNKGPVIAVSVVLLALVGGILGTSFGLIQAEQHRKIAEKAESDTLDEFRSSTDEAIEKLIGSKKEYSEREKTFLENTQKRWEVFATRTGDDERSRAIRAEGHHRVASLLVKLGHRDQALKNYEAGRALWRSLVNDFPAKPEYRFGLGKTQLNLGNINKDIGQQKEAKAELEASRDLFQQLSDSYPDEASYLDALTKSHHGLAVLLDSGGNGKESFQELLTARDLNKKLVTKYPTIPVYRAELALAHVNIAKAYSDWEKTTESRTELELARNLQLKLIEEYPANSYYRQGLARTQNQFAKLSVNLGNRSMACTELKVARDIYFKLVDDFPSFPEYRQELAGIHINLGTQLGNLGKSDEAHKELIKARDIVKKLVSDFPGVIGYQRLLGNVHNNLGTILLNSKQFDDARIEYQTALEIHKKQGNQVALGGSYCNIGRVLQVQGKHADSLEWFNNAFETLLPILEKEPRDFTTKQFLWNVLQNLGQAYDALGRYDEAVKANGKILELDLCPDANKPKVHTDRALSRIRAGQIPEGIAEINEVMITKAENKDARWSLFFACAYSIASGKESSNKEEYAAQAVKLLQKAVRLGFKDSALLLKDKDLVPLRHRDDFKKLIAVLEKTSPPTEAK